MENARQDPAAPHCTLSPLYENSVELIGSCREVTLAGTAASSQITMLNMVDVLGFCVQREYAVTSSLR